MNFAMVPAAERDRKLIADFAAERATLCKAQMVRIGWLATAHQARMLCNELYVLAIAQSTRLRPAQSTLVDRGEAKSQSGLTLLERCHDRSVAGLLLQGRLHGETA